jgi:type IV pilus assembly protein PilY1
MVSFKLAAFKNLSPLCFGLLVASMVPASLMAQPAQKPLLSFEGGGVKPDIMLTMDDSGSMTWQHMPETTIYVGPTPFVTSPVGSQGTKADPDDVSTGVNFFGTVAGQPGNSNYRQKLMRSPDTNTIYYNPEVRYLPWAMATYPLPNATTTNPAGRLANSPVAAAFRDPMNMVGGGIVNLTNVRSGSTTVNVKWCFQNANTACSSSAENYDPGLYYRLKKDVTGAFLRPDGAGNYTEYSINASATTAFLKYPARLDCAGTSCTRDEERQNFANWFSYYRTRNLMARGAISEAFADAADNFRIGWGRINQTSSRSIDGVNTTVIEQGVRDFTATTKAALFSWLQTLPANGSTPLPGALDAVGQYYMRNDAKGPWSDGPGVGRTESDKTCRRAYNVMVTDGYWNVNASTSRGNVDGKKITNTANYTYMPVPPYTDGISNTLADYAMYYWVTDLRADLANKVKPSPGDPAFWQHLNNFTVGLGVRGTLDPLTDLPALTAGTKTWGSDRIDDLWHAALDSRGSFFSAKDPVELSKAVRSVVDRASAEAFKEGGVATASTQLQGNNRKYVPQYKYGSWVGDVIAYELDANGVPGLQLWSAQSNLPAWASRNIVTWNQNTSAGAAFTWNGIGALNQTKLGTLTTVPASSGENLVNFLRGDQSNEGDGKAFRQRVNILGDFVNSNPVLVAGSGSLGYESLTTGGAAYASYIAAKATRTPTLFIGGNDGMLHAFKDTLGKTTGDGAEVFAYVPKTVFGNLSMLANKSYGTLAMYHQFFVDGPQKESDAYVKAPGASAPSWRNYLLSSLGAGGRAVFALDVTNAPTLDATAIRWEINGDTYADLGYVQSQVEVGVLPNGEWVAVFGNGRFSINGKAALFVVNLETGSVQTLQVGTVGSNGLGGVAVVKDGFGQITNLYAGDATGSLWRFDYSSTASSRFQVAGGAAFFTTSDTTQAITQAPAIFDHSQGGKIVVFGTGRLMSLADVSSLSTQAVYGVWDKVGDTVARPMTRSVLATRTLSAVTGALGAQFFSLSGTAVDWALQRGWAITLDAPAGMQVIYPLQKVTSKIVLVSAVKPADSSDVCASTAGAGMNLMIPVETGTNPTYPFFDVNGDGAINASDPIVVGYATNADGVDAIVTGTTVCSGAVCNTKIVLENTTGYQTANLQDLNSSSRTVRDRVWRRIINPPIR